MFFIPCLLVIFFCLSHFCRWGHLTIVRFLIDDHQCETQPKNIYGQTPLHLACWWVFIIDKMYMWDFTLQFHISPLSGVFIFFLLCACELVLYVALYAVKMFVMLYIPAGYGKPVATCMCFCLWSWMSYRVDGYLHVIAVSLLMEGIISPQDLYSHGSGHMLHHYGFCLYMYIAVCIDPAHWARPFLTPLHI